MTRSRTLHFDQMFLLAVVALCSLITLPQLVSVGPISGLGLATLATFGIAVALFAMHPTITRAHACLFPFLLYFLYGSATLLYSGVEFPGIQYFLVNLALPVLALVTSRQVMISPAFGARLWKWMGVGFKLAPILYALSVAATGFEADALFNARGFALFGVLATAYHLTVWRGGDRRGLIWALITIAVIFASMSRTALVVAVGLIPLSVVIRGSLKSILQTLMMTALAGAALVVAVLSYKPMYDRFFAYDTSIQIQGVAINASGRMEMWKDLYESWTRSPKGFLFGQGIASTSPLTNRPGMYHPHNEYLRWGHDLGLVGLCLYVSGIAWITMVMVVRARHVAPGAPGHLQVHLCVVLSLVGIMLTAFTDNTLSYMYIMAPLGVMVGCSMAFTMLEQPVGRRAVVRPRPRGT
jgi:O-antigen ligase